MCDIDKERNKIVNCLCCKHCLPPNKRINGELCSLKINNKNNIMEIFTHLIITRFMCQDFISDNANVNFNSPEWIEMSFDMASRHIIPTLENQTNKDFTLVFLVGNNTTPEIAQKIYHLSNIINIMVVRYNEFDVYIQSIPSDYLITSRLDYDDHVYNECVEDIHKLLDEKPDIKLWGLNQGVSIVDGEDQAYLMRREKFEQDKEGFFAPMETLILKKTACNRNKYFDIYKLGYHTEVIRNFLNTQRIRMKRDDYELKDIYATTNERNIDYIWIRHNNSASALAFNIIHTTNVKVELSYEELVKRFGYDFIPMPK